MTPKKLVFLYPIQVDWRNSELITNFTFSGDITLSVHAGQWGKAPLYFHTYKMKSLVDVLKSPANSEVFRITEFI